MRGLPVAVAARDVVGQPRAQVGADAGDERRRERRDDDLGQEHPEVDGVDARAHDGRADEAAEERMRGRGRQSEPPRRHVPDDRADEAGEDELGSDLDAAVAALLDDAAGDRLRHLGGEERADEVEHGGQGDGGLRLDRAGGDRCRHGVGRIVEAVGEVEEECQCDDEHDDEDDFHSATLNVDTTGTGE